MPDESVAHCPDIVLATEIHQGVRLRPIPRVFLRMDACRLHRILRSEDVELRFDELHLGCIELIGSAEVQCRADHEGIPVGIFQRWCGRLRRGTQARAEKNTGSGQKGSSRKIVVDHWRHLSVTEISTAAHRADHHLRADRRRGARRLRLPASHRRQAARNPSHLRQPR